MPEDEVVIYEGELELIADGRQHSVIGRVCSSLQPRPVVRVSIDTASLSSPPDLLGCDAEIRFGGLGEAHRVFFVRMNGSVVNGALAMTASGIVVGTEPGTAHVDAITFELINFPVRATSYSDGPILADGWCLELTPKLSLNVFDTTVERDALFVPTFDAALWRDDGESFSVQQGLNALDAVRAALSFVAGSRVGLWNLQAALSDRQGALRWFGSPDVAPWYGCHQWLGTLDIGGLGIILRALLGRRSQAEEIWEVDHLLIEYHAEANGFAPLEMRVAAAQAGLELLAWDHLVESGKSTLGTTRSERKSRYTGLTASAIIELMIQQASIPLTIPVGAAALTPLGVRDGDLSGASTGPVAVARVRNAVTHPRRRNGGLSYPPDVWTAGWQLSMHYLELLILWRLGYSSAYVDRFVAGSHSDVQQLPWTSHLPNATPDGK